MPVSKEEMMAKLQEIKQLHQQADEGLDEVAARIDLIESAEPGLNELEEAEVFAALNEQVDRARAIASEVEALKGSVQPPPDDSGTPEDITPKPNE